jgi:hypothetical protein
VAVDSDSIQNLFKKEGFVAEIDPASQYPIEFRQQDEEGTAKIGSHYFGRIGLEMISLEWLVAEMISTFRKTREELQSDNAESRNLMPLPGLGPAAE